MVILAGLEAILGPLGAILGHLGTLLGHLGAILVPLGMLLGRSWSSPEAWPPLTRVRAERFGTPPLPKLLAKANSD